MARKALTYKQQAFVDAYAGNGTEAARIAGYKGNDVVLAQVAAENLRKPQIQKAIQARQKPIQNKRIANREARQAFWTKAMRDTKQPLQHRLTASALLAKSEGDFITRHEHTGADGGPIEHKHTISPELQEALNAVYLQK
jgi:phage terminase small subunit